MGYNDPMPTEPDACECGVNPTVYEVPPKRIVVQCDACGMTGQVSDHLQIAVSFWNMGLGRSIAGDELRAVLQNSKQTHEEQK